MRHPLHRNSKSPYRAPPTTDQNPGPYNFEQALESLTATPAIIRQELNQNNATQAAATTVEWLSQIGNSLTQIFNPFGLYVWPPQPNGTVDLYISGHNIEVPCRAILLINNPHPVPYAVKVSTTKKSLVMVNYPYFILRQNDTAYITVGLHAPGFPSEGQIYPGQFKLHLAKREVRDENLLTRYNRARNKTRQTNIAKEFWERSEPVHGHPDGKTFVNIRVLIIDPPGSQPRPLVDWPGAPPLGPPAGQGKHI
ncbi:hypothetical protein DdX_04253 [Ditylenchus destructor]|uniref:Major sperm protein n=1 Tax=Ditylenchus destructor TaxID=166010 RepID=A0AAD4N7Z2_9BILA|nr:hypothetical protein DdX_04253 [Ditylenchus destructor]